MCIQVQQITYIHPDKEVLFRNLSFTVGRGRQLALIGNNGCGKSTLLQIMAGKLQPSSGNVLRPDDLYYVPQPSGCQGTPSLFNHSGSVLTSPGLSVS